MQILFGVIGGLGWSLIGTAKEMTKKEREDFDAKKFVKSIILGAIIGGVLGAQGNVVEIATIEEFTTASFLYTPIVAIVDKVIGIIWNGISRVL